MKHKFKLKQITASLVRTILRVLLFIPTVFASIMVYRLNIMVWVREVVLGNPAISQECPDATHIHVPGNSEVTPCIPCIYMSNNPIIHRYAPSAKRLLSLYSLEDAAEDIADLIQRQCEIQNNLSLSGISIGGATLILALDKLRERNFDFSKIEKVRIINTFNSLPNAIAGIASRNRLIYLPLIIFLIHISLKLVFLLSAAVFSLPWLSSIGFLSFILVPELSSMIYTAAMILIPSLMMLNNAKPLGHFIAFLLNSRHDVLAANNRVKDCIKNYKFCHQVNDEVIKDFARLKGTAGYARPYESFCHMQVPNGFMN